MSLYLGNDLIAPNQSNAANKSLSNLDATGQAVIDGKADIDLSNISDTGYIKMAKAGMPSSTWITLTAGASDSTYIAPADGYVQWSVRASSAGVLIGLSNTTGNLASYLTCVNAGYLYAAYIPVKKGQTFGIYYSSGLSENNLFFTYAVGSESEVS
jgi:hypothetical protein